MPIYHLNSTDAQVIAPAAIAMQSERTRAAPTQLPAIAARIVMVTPPMIENATASATRKAIRPVRVESLRLLSIRVLIIKVEDSIGPDPKHLSAPTCFPNRAGTYPVYYPIM